MREENTKRKNVHEVFCPFYCWLGAALKNVSDEFWRLPRAYGGSVIRERAFCYELYHQLRMCQIDLRDNRLNGLLDLTVTGEIDKRGYSVLETNEQKNPDFVFHKAGESCSNEVVMEVKGRIDGRYIEEIINDFDTLALFIAHPYLHYNIGVFLLYGKTMPELKRLIRENFCKIQENTQTRANASITDGEIYRRIILVVQKERSCAPEVTDLASVMEDINHGHSSTR